MSLINSQDWTFYEFEFPNAKPWNDEFRRFIELLSERYKVKNLRLHNDVNATILVYDKEGRRPVNYQDISTPVKKLAEEHGLEVKFRGEYNFSLQLDITTML